jgi:hypothetical protein
MSEQGTGISGQESGFAAPGPCWKNLIGPAIILFAALVALTPLIVKGNSCGHDFDFHLVSWFDALQNWRQGILYPRWSPNSNYGAGEPRFIFYPPISWMLGAVLGAIMHWRYVPLAIRYIFLAGTGFATRALARQALDDAPATLAGCAALFSGYALYNAYERADFGELAGGIWIPLLLLFIFRDRHPSGSTLRRAFDGSAAPLAVVLACAWLSNAPLGVMASYLLVAVALVVALLARSWAPVLRATASAVLGLGLATFFILPAAYERRWVDMRQILDDPGYKLENNWLFARHPSIPSLDMHDVELFKASSIAVTMIAVALACILVCWGRGRLPGARRWWLPLALMPGVILFLQFPVSDWLWNLLPEMRYLQFPWRWLVTLQAPMAIFFASAVWVIRPRLRWLTIVACSALFLCATALAGWNFFQNCDEEDAVWSMYAVYRSGAGFIGTDEYEPPWGDNTVLAMGLPQSCLATSPTAALGEGSEGAPLEWSPDQHSCIATYAAAPDPSQPAAEHLKITALTPQAGTLILRLRSYPAWQVRLNGQFIDHLPERDDGLIAVPVPQGPVTVTADWTTTRDVLLSRWLTGLALILITGLYVLEKRFAPPRLR